MLRPHLLGYTGPVICALYGLSAVAKRSNPRTVLEISYMEVFEINYGSYAYHGTYSIEVRRRELKLQICNNSNVCTLLETHIYTYYIFAIHTVLLR